MPSIFAISCERHILAAEFWDENHPVLFATPATMLSNAMRACRQGAQAHLFYKFERNHLAFAADMCMEVLTIIL